MQSFWPFGQERLSGQSKMYRMGAQRGAAAGYAPHDPYRQAPQAKGRGGVTMGTGGGYLTTPSMTTSEPDPGMGGITNTGYTGGSVDTGVLSNPSATTASTGTTATGRPYDFYFSNPTGNPNATAKPAWQTKTMQMLARGSRNPRAAFMGQWAGQYPRLAAALGYGNYIQNRALRRRLPGGMNPGRVTGGYGSDDRNQAPQFEEYLQAMGELPRPPQLPNYGNTMGGGTNYPGAEPGSLDAQFGPARPWWPWPWS